MRSLSIAFAAASLSLAAAASADLILIEAQLSAANEVPPTNSSATGVLTGVLDTDSSQFTFEWSIQDLTGTPGAPGAHFHRAPAGQNGGVAFAITGGAWDLAGNGVWNNISASDMARFFDSTLYANFHTDTFPGGELRGQLEVVPTPGAAAVLGVAGLVGARRRR